jgi:hypothetical protein
VELLDIAISLLSIRASFVRTQIGRYSAGIVSNYASMRETAMAGEWWDGIQSARLEEVMRFQNPKVKSALTVTSEGILWGVKGNKRTGYVSIPWNAVGYLETGVYRMERGNQRSAFGFGPVGVAIVAANAVRNARNSQILEYHYIRIVDGRGTPFDFLTMRTNVEIASVLGPTADAIERRNAAIEAASAPPSLPVSVPDQGHSVADELAKLAELHVSGVLTDEEFAVQKEKILES